MKVLCIHRITILLKKNIFRVRSSSFHGKTVNNKRYEYKHFNSSCVAAAVTVEGCNRGIISKEMQYLFIRLTDTAVKH